MKKLAVQLRWSPQETLTVGQIAEADRRIYFEYDADFLRRGLQLSPFKWPPRPGLIEHVDRNFGPLPGLFDDSLPDGWGLLLMDRLFRKRGLDLASLSPLDRLAYVGTHAMGSLTYHPPTTEEAIDHRIIDLHAIGKNAREIHSGEAADVLPELMRAGGSAGGARPKVLVGVKGKNIISGEDELPPDFEPWIVKFSATADMRDAGPVEYAYSLMARAAGIDMPETKLFQVGKNEAYFGVRRFDRDDQRRRLHVHTFGNLIHANFRIPSTDYADLLKVTRTLTRNHQDVLKVFRRMVFNIVAHNRDDHAKNFAFVMNPAGEWSLSPAYDLTYAAGPGGEHTMTVAGEGREPTREYVLKLAEQFDIKLKQAGAIIGEVKAAADQWAKFAAEAGCTKKCAQTIKAVIRRV
ncbi:MAG TPA: type II toxin-antitoxin system HipA family toxin [Tepidisphaeraceae bacterium]|nr:type II toxin-antitoxin system HipA family toxin [Tepidisphaeraceae bacterium]